MNSDDSRQTRRRRVLMGAKIVFGEGTGTLDCSIVDSSPGGARLRLKSKAIVPHSFNLIDIRSGTAHEVETVWSRSQELGVRYLASTSLRGDVGAPLKHLQRLWATLQA